MHSSRARGEGAARSEAEAEMRASRSHQRMAVAAPRLTSYSEFEDQELEADFRCVLSRCLPSLHEPTPGARGGVPAPLGSAPDAPTPHLCAHRTRCSHRRDEVQHVLEARAAVVGVAVSAVVVLLAIGCTGFANCALYVSIFMLALMALANITLSARLNTQLRFAYHFYRAVEDGAVERQQTEHETERELELRTAEAKKEARGRLLRVVRRLSHCSPHCLPLLCLHSLSATLCTRDKWRIRSLSTPTLCQSLCVRQLLGGPQPSQPAALPRQRSRGARRPHEEQAHN
jgi:hypothetical protein